MAGIVTVSGNALTAYPVVAIEGWSAAISSRYESTPVPGGLLNYAASMPAVEPRIITLSLLVSAASVAVRGAAIDTLMALFPRETLLRLTFDDDSNKEVRGYVTHESVRGITDTTSFVHGSAIVTFEITCFDPAKYDTSDTVTNVGTDTAIALGSLAHGGKIRIVAGTNPVITYKNGAGTTVQTFGITLALTGSDYVEIDLDLRAVTKSVSSVLSNALSTWTSGNFFTIEPRHKSGLTNPSLSCSSGTCTFTHRKKWRS